MPDLKVLLDRRERSQSLQYDYARRATTEIRRCNACGQISSSLLAHRDRYGFEASFRECNNCGLVWISPRMSKADYADFYENWYRPLLTAWYGESMAPDKIVKDQVKYTELLLLHPDIISELERKRGGTLLDVGGSTGVVSDMLRAQFGFVVTVLDPSSDELEMAKERGLEVIHGVAEDLPVSNKYDVILLLQTIEHLLDPKSVLQRLRGALAPGGILLMDFVPFNEQRQNIRPIEQVLKIDHPYYFSKDCTYDLVQSCHFKVRTIISCTGRHFHYVCEAA